MKIQNPFLALCLAALTNISVVLSAPASGAIKGKVAHLGDSSSYNESPVGLVQGSHASTSSGHQAEALPWKALHSHTKSLQEADALHAFAHRPKNSNDVKAIVEQDLTKIAHQQHLSNLDADGSIHMVNRLLAHAESPMKDRQVAFDAIVEHGGKPGLMKSGAPEAQEHHLRYADAMKKLYQLKGPLTAAEHRAVLNGERVAGRSAAAFKENIDHDHKSPIEMSQQFVNHVGPPSDYHYVHPDTNKITSINTLKKEEANLKAEKENPVENKVANSRL